MLQNILKILVSLKIKSSWVLETGSLFDSSKNRIQTGTTLGGTSVKLWTPFPENTASQQNCHTLEEVSGGVRASEAHSVPGTLDSSKNITSPFSGILLWVAPNFLSPSKSTRKLGNRHCSSPQTGESEVTVCLSLQEVGLTIIEQNELCHYVCSQPECVL